MRLFNAFQLTCLFGAGPFIINYLDEATFRFAGVAYWVALAAYLVSFCATVAAYWELIDE